ncbi:MAG: hypothetical protein KAT65_02620 [Methanophagales archaeon]|nr:hypothetical protein [Methanophagales archaeon]
MIKDTDLSGGTYYLQKDKINDVYGTMVGEVVEKIISQEQVTSGRSVDAKISFGKVLTWLGLDTRIGGSLTRENAMSNEVIKELSYERKLLIALNALEKDGKCCDLNERQDIIKPTQKHIYFKGEANFSLREEKSEQFLVEGIVENYKFKSFCSKEHIVSPSLSDFLLYLSMEEPEPTLDVFCAGYIMHQREKSLFLTLYYIGGL